MTASDGGEITAEVVDAEVVTVPVVDGADPDAAGEVEVEVLRGLTTVDGVETATEVDEDEK